MTTFGCVEWESEQFRGVMRARSYPFKMPKRRFHGVNPQVYMVVYPSTYSTYKYIPVHTSMYQYILVYTSTYQYVLPPVPISPYQDILVCPGMY